MVAQTSICVTNLAMKSIPLTLQTLYADLVQQVGAASPDEATVAVNIEKGIRYLRLQRWVGGSRVVEHLGRADDPAIIARADAARGEMQRRQERRKLVSALRRLVPGPSPALGKVLDTMSASGLFRNGAVLIGTAAYQCYPPLVGHVLPAAGVMTQDADLATADLALTADIRGESLETILKRADSSFAAVMGLDPRTLPSRFRSSNGFMVDLLTPQRRRTDTNPMPLTGLAAGAVPLQHLDWLMVDPVPALVLHGAGVAVIVPQPARFAVHKLILAQKRPAADRIKRGKDLAQASALITALEQHDPYALEDALEDARGRGKFGWAGPLRKSLNEIGQGSQTTA